MKFGKVVAFALVTVAMVLAGCGTAPVEPSTPTAIPRPKYLPTLSVTYSTPLPSDTPKPTRTPDSFATMTAQAGDATLQYFFMATKIARSTELAVFPTFPPGCNSYLSYMTSKNGDWIAITGCYMPDPTLVVLNNSGSKLWKIHYLDYSYFHNDGYIIIQHWSNDSRYLYFSTAFFGSGGLCYVGYDGGGFGLFRLDVQTGIVDTLLPLRTDQTHYVWSFSPTGRRFIYAQSHNSLGVWDMLTGDITPISIPNNLLGVGGFLWSDDGTKIIYTMSLLMSEQNYYHELYLTDLSTNSTHLLMKPPLSKCVRADSWAGNNELNIEVLDETTWTSSEIRYDINSNQIISTPVPTPTP